jgi:TM2 domain-containing membrane protein YozV
MPKWKDITSLSEQSEKAREAAFEAQMLAAVATDKPASAPPVINPSTPNASIRDGIQISVTGDGQTALYNLETAPWAVRQLIMNAWRPASTTNIPPPQIVSSPAPRQKKMRTAMTLNLLLPGAGQFYFGQRIAGSVYAIGFIACLATMLVLFTHAYSTYLQLSTNGDIMESGNLEQLTQVFHAGMLGWISFIGTALYIASTIHLVASRRSK